MQILRNCPDFANNNEPKTARKNDVSYGCFKNAALGANFNVIKTSQYNDKSNACYTMTSIFARGPVTSISKSHVLAACAHKNFHINTWLSFH